MEVPADGLVIDANEICTDESAMTGESHIINKNTPRVCLKKKS